MAKYIKAERRGAVYKVQYQHRNWVSQSLCPEAVYWKENYFMFGVEKNTFVESPEITFLVLVSY